MFTSSTSKRAASLGLNSVCVSCVILGRFLVKNGKILLWTFYQKRGRLFRGLRVARKLCRPNRKMNTIRNNDVLNASHNVVLPLEFQVKESKL
jgi:hypothetical protein